MNLNKLLKKLRLPFLILFIFYACTSEHDYVEEKKQVEPLTISGAQTWYNQHFGSAPRLKSSGNEDEDFPAMEPDWNLAELSADSLWYVVEMPVVMEEHKGVHIMSEDVSRYVSEKGDKSLAKQLLRMVVMRNKEDGKTYSFMMAVLPDLDYMLEKGQSIEKNKYLTRESDLSGLVFYYNIDGSFINGWTYKDGKITGGTHFPKGEQPRQKAMTVIIIETCWYQDTYVQKPDGTLEHTGTKRYCKNTVHYINHDDNSIFADGEGDNIGGGVDPELIDGGGITDDPSKDKDKKPEDRDDCGGKATENANKAEKAMNGSPTINSKLNTLRDYAINRVNEHSTYIGINKIGAYTIANIKEGINGDSDVDINEWTIYNVHTHTDDPFRTVFTGPSVGDIQSLLGANWYFTDGNYTNLEGIIIFAYDGSEYLLSINDRTQAYAFAKTNLSLFDCNDNAEFINLKMREDYKSIYNKLISEGYSVQDSNDYAMSYLLDKHKTGLKISKKEKNDKNFGEMKTEEKSNEYKPKKCPGQ